MKKIIKIILVIFILILLGYMNIKDNSVYYAKNMPNVNNKEFQMMMLIDTMNYSRINGDKEDGLYYEIDGNNMIKNAIGEKEIVFANDPVSTRYTYYDKNEIEYEFDQKFKLINVSPVKFNTDSGNELKYNYEDDDAISKVNEKAIKDEIYKMLKPAIDKETKPLINLQFIFNFMYKDRFK